MNTQQLAICPSYGNCLTRIEKYVSDTCIYLRPLTGKFSNGLINVSKEDIIAIPESNNLTIVQHIWGNEPLDIVKF
jgi:hypothetical protein